MTLNRRTFLQSTGVANGIAVAGINATGVGQGAGTTEADGVYL